MWQDPTETMLAHYKSRADRSMGDQPLPTGLAECTFAPAVNAPLPGMTAAQKYLSESVFDRLTP